MLIYWATISFITLNAFSVFTTSPSKDDHYFDDDYEDLRGPPPIPGNMTSSQLSNHMTMSGDQLSDHMTGSHDQQMADTQLNMESSYLSSHAGTMPHSDSYLSIPRNNESGTVNAVMIMGSK